jgi:hypothetical protein
MPTISRKYYLFLVVGVLALVLGLWLAYRHNQQKDELVLVEVRPFNSSFGWGYEIVAGGKVYIHQEFIPAIPGKHGFKTSGDALKVGKLVVSKISAKQMPPTITVNELKELGIVSDSLASR